jgi:hypothetical protein
MRKRKRPEHARADIPGQVASSSIRAIRVIRGSGFPNALTFAGSISGITWRPRARIDPYLREDLHRPSARRGGRHTFDPPWLCGVSQAAPYFHDGRARTLVEVVTRYRHQLSGALSDHEVRDLLPFLGSL